MPAETLYLLNFLPRTSFPSLLWYAIELRATWHIWFIWTLWFILFPAIFIEIEAAHGDLLFQAGIGLAELGYTCSLSPLCTGRQREALDMNYTIFCHLPDCLGVMGD
jgi:hypothetical protein